MTVPAPMTGYSQPDPQSYRDRDLHVLHDDISYYARLITGILICDTATAVLVEELMRADLLRANRAGLGDLPMAAFASLARRAYADATVMADAGELESYCEALDIEVPPMLRACEACGAHAGEECYPACLSGVEHAWPPERTEQ